MNWQDVYRIKFVADVAYLGNRWYVVEISTNRKIMGCISREQAKSFARWKTEQLELQIEEIVL